MTTHEKLLKKMTEGLGARIKDALETAVRYGGIDGDHHKQWVIDQMVRSLTGCPKIKHEKTGPTGIEWQWEELGESEEYKVLVKDAKNGEDGPETYVWNIGIAP